MGFSKVEKVALGLLVGGVLGAIVSIIIGRFPPFTLNPEDPSPLDLSNQGFIVFGGVGTGSILGAGLALASE